MEAVNRRAFWLSAAFCVVDGAQQHTVDSLCENLWWEKERSRVENGSHHSSWNLLFKRGLQVSNKLAES